MRTWEECAGDEFGTLYVDRTIEGEVDEGRSRLTVRYLVMRGTVALVAYVGVPYDYPSAGWDTHFDIPLEVHGDVTWAHGGDELRPAGWWWYGWDYSHYGDRSFPPVPSFPDDSTAWDVEMVERDAEEAAHRMLALVAANWHPSAEEQAQAAERRRDAEEFRRRMRSGEALAEMYRMTAKMERLRKLEG